MTSPVPLQANRIPLAVSGKETCAFLLAAGQAILDGDALEDLAAEGFVFGKAPADEDVVALFGFAGDFDGGAEEADVAHVMLSAGIGAAGEVDVNGLVEFDFFIEVVGEFDGVGFGV